MSCKKITQGDMEMLNVTQFKQNTYMLSDSFAYIKNTKLFQML